MQLKAKIDFSERGVLNLGSETGIFSILAVHLGAATSRAINHDRLSTECAEKSKILKNTPAIQEVLV